MRLSAIIPTHNRPELLRQCLETLQAQEVEPARLEVVVVDDGSSSDIAGLVAEVAGQGPVTMRCERQELSGLNGARNRGVGVAQGELLAFLDDDTLVSRAWAQALLDVFREYPCAAVGGRIELGLPTPAPAWMASRGYYLAEYDRGAEGEWIEADPLPVGANCAVRRREFESIGGFRRGLDRLGGSLVSNGDTEFFRRLRAAGGRMRYEPRASVIHQVPPERMTLRYFDRRHYAQGISDELLSMLEGGPAGWRHRVRLAGGVADALKVLARDIARGRGPLEGRFDAQYWAGRLTASLKGPRALGPLDYRPPRR